MVLVNLTVWRSSNTQLRSTKSLDPLGSQPVGIEILERPFSVAAAEGSHVIFRAPFHAPDKAVDPRNFEMSLRDVPCLPGRFLAPTSPHEHAGIRRVFVHRGIVRREDR